MYTVNVRRPAVWKIRSYNKIIGTIESRTCRISPRGGDIEDFVPKDCGI
jgi:hypothetical protein